MEACHDDITALLHIQQIDLDILRQKKQLDELPQRSLILDARKKRAAVKGKQEKVDALKKDIAKRLTRVSDEDASLAKKEAGTQAAINAAQGDYRNVQARTKELAGIAKRREALAEDRAKIDAELEKVSGLEAQVRRALEEIDAAEARAIESFQKEGGALKVKITQLEAKRASAAEAMNPQILKLYEKTAARAGGVAVGVLNGTQCGVCRANLEGGRLIELRSQAPLGTCPACKRLLIVE